MNKHNNCGTKHHTGEIISFDHDVPNCSVQIPKNKKWDDEQAGANAVASHRASPPVNHGRQEGTQSTSKGTQRPEDSQNGALLSRGPILGD